MSATELVDTVESYSRTRWITGHQHRAEVSEFLTVLEDWGILLHGNFFDRAVELMAMGRERSLAIATAYLMGAYK